MSVKPRQFTVATENGPKTIYVNMTRKEYKQALKAAKAGQPFELDGKKYSIFDSQKSQMQSPSAATYLLGAEAAETGLVAGDGNMEKNYKALQSQYETTLKTKYMNAGMPEKDAAKVAKKEAKELVESEKAADEVISAKYFGPNQKKEYDEYKEKIKNAKPGDPEYNRHAVKLENDDITRMKQLGLIDENSNGNIPLDDESQAEIKIKAAKLVGDDNKLSYKERFDKTRIAKNLATNEDGSEGKAISHGSARITKNLFKHLGFDHAHDYTEAIIAAGVATTAAGIGLSTITVGATSGGWVTDLVGAGGGIDKWVAGAAGHKLLAAGIPLAVLGAGTVAASQIHDRSQTPQAQLAQAQETDPVETDPVENDPVENDPVENDPVENDPVENEPTIGAARGRAVDQGIVKRHGVTVDELKPGTNPMDEEDKGQYALANEDGEIDTTTYGGEPEEPNVIIINDNTNNNVNKYQYRKLTPEEISNGKLEDGTPIKIGNNHDDKKSLYVLVSADKDNGKDIKSTHVEIYELNAQPVKYEDGVTRWHYDLQQKEGMSGYNQSSIDYAKRGTTGRNGVDFRWGNWTRNGLDKPRQEKVKSYNATTADQLLEKLMPAPNRADLIAANPSVFDSNGNVKPNVEWSKLDLPKGTVFLD